MPATEITDFYVTGSGEFPFDMLRHDECWPANAMAAVAMNEGIHRRKILMRTWRWVNVHPARWDSFNWRCEMLPEREEA